MSCPTPYHGPNNPGHGYNFALAELIFYPIFLVICLSYFLYYRKKSVYLRKRSAVLMMFGIFGISLIWVDGAVYEIVGPTNWPCSVFLLILYISNPISMAAHNVKLVRYSSEVAAARLVQERMKLKEQRIAPANGEIVVEEETMNPSLFAASSS